MDVDWDLFLSEARAIVQELALLPAADRAALLDDIAPYPQEVETANKARDLVDLKLAQRLAQGLSTLVRGAGAHCVEERNLVGAAVRYFILAEDADGDSDSLPGIEDDAEVFKTVPKLLGRGDLTVDLWSW